MKTASALPAILLVLAWATGVSVADALPRRPNVIFIVTDDQGWGDARFAGHPYVKTPHLDWFAREGTWFRQFYVAATVCPPSRARPRHDRRRRPRGEAVGGEEDRGQEGRPSQPVAGM